MAVLSVYVPDIRFLGDPLAFDGEGGVKVSSFDVVLRAQLMLKPIRNAFMAMGIAAKGSLLAQTKLGKGNVIENGVADSSVLAVGAVIIIMSTACAKNAV